MDYTLYNKNGTTVPVSETVADLPERLIIELYPLAQRIVNNETGADVWVRTIAFFPGDYDPGRKILKP